MDSLLPLFTCLVVHVLICPPFSHFAEDNRKQLIHLRRHSVLRGAHVHARTHTHTLGRLSNHVYTNVNKLKSLKYSIYPKYEFKWHPGRRSKGDLCTWMKYCSDGYWVSRSSLRAVGWKNSGTSRWKCAKNKLLNSVTFFPGILVRASNQIKIKYDFNVIWDTVTQCMTYVCELV